MKIEDFSQEGRKLEGEKDIKTETQKDKQKRHRKEDRKIYIKTDRRTDRMIESQNDT